MSGESPTHQAMIEELERPGTVAELGMLLERAQAAEGRAALAGRSDLVIRARLVQADAMIRTGRTAAGGRLAREIYRIVEAGDDRYLLARAELVLARFFRHLGDRQTQLEHAVRAAQLLPPDAHPLVRYDHELALAIALTAMGSYDSARRSYQRLQALTKEHGGPNHRLGMLNNAAVNEWAAGQLAGALRFADEMVRLSEQLEEPLQPAYYETWGRILLDSGRAEEAVAVLRRALDPDVLRLASDSDAVPVAMLTLAEALRGTGALAEAYDLLDDCVRLTEEGGLAEIHASAKKEMAYVLAAQDRFEDAFGAYVAFHDEWQRLTSVDREARSRIIQAVYEATEAREESERYRELSMHDPLTDLANRRYVQERLPALLIEGRQEGFPVAVALVDLDHFKVINDTCSHEAGDKVLVVIGELLAQAVADGIAARMGGEEFLLVLPRHDRSAAVEMGERVRAAVAGHDWSDLTGDLAVTASIGMAVAFPGERLPEELLREADAALYRAKRAGRNRVVLGG